MDRKIEAEIIYFLKMRDFSRLAIFDAKTKSFNSLHSV